MSKTIIGCLALLSLSLSQLFFGIQIGICKFSLGTVDISEELGCKNSQVANIHLIRELKGKKHITNNTKRDKKW